MSTVCFLFLSSLGSGIDFMHFAVDPQAHETLRAQFVEQVDLFALAAHHQRREDHQLGVFRQRQDVIHHLRNALGGKHDVVLGAVRVADAGIQQAQVIVDFGDRADGRARVVAGGFLLDGDRRRQAFDQIHIGLFHQLQKLARIGGERFDVAPLTFGIKRIESERGFA